MKKIFLTIVLFVLALTLVACNPRADTADDLIVPGVSAADLGTPTSVSPTSVPPTAAPATVVSATSVPATAVPPTVAPATPVPATAVPPTVAPMSILVVEADQVFNANGELPAYSDFRAAVRTPGDTAKFVIRFTVPMTDVVLSRVWPDDILEGATFQKPGQDPINLLAALSMITVTKTSPVDPSVRQVMKTRGVDIANGELLPQNRNAIFLGNVPAGSVLVFFIKDDVAKQVNRGMGAVLSNVIDAYTVDLTGKTVATTVK